MPPVAGATSFAVSFGAGALGAVTTGAGACAGGAAAAAAGCEPAATGLSTTLGSAGGSAAPVSGVVDAVVTGSRGGCGSSRLPSGSDVCAVSAVGEPAAVFAELPPTT